MQSYCRVYLDCWLLMVGELTSAASARARWRNRRWASRFCSLLLSSWSCFSNCLFWSDSHKDAFIFPICDSDDIIVCVRCEFINCFACSCATPRGSKKVARLYLPVDRKVIRSKEWSWCARQELTIARLDFRGSTVRPNINHFLFHGTFLFTIKKVRYRISMHLICIRSVKKCACQIDPFFSISLIALIPLT